MNVRRESGQEAYDVIVVGSGTGGLSAAGLLAKAGRRVLVVERDDRPGGYAQAFRRTRHYLFDAAVHLTSGCQPTPQVERGVIDTLLRYLGVRDRCDFVAVDPFYTVDYPGLRLCVGVGEEAFVAAHASAFLTEAGALGALVRLCSQINQQARLLPAELSLADVVRLPSSSPPCSSTATPRLERCWTTTSPTRGSRRPSPRCGPTWGCRRRGCLLCTGA